MPPRHRAERERSAIGEAIDWAHYRNRELVFRCGRAISGSVPQVPAFPVGQRAMPWRRLADSEGARGPDQRACHDRKGFRDARPGVACVANRIRDPSLA